MRAFEPDVEAFLDRRLFPDSPDDRDVQALGCLAPETFASIYLSILMTLFFLTDDHVECLRELFSVTDFSAIIASILPDGYDADYVDAFFDGFLDCVPEEILTEEPVDPTPTSTPTPTPISTPTATPITELTLPAPEYLTQEIPPCTPIPGSSVDPCEPRAERDQANKSHDLILVEPPQHIDDLLEGSPTTPVFTTHNVLRGTYIPGTIRCTSGHRIRYPSYVGEGMGGFSIFCFADVRVNAYLMGTGPSTLTVIVEEIYYAWGSGDDDDYGLSQLESRRLAHERALADGGRFKYAPPLRTAGFLPGELVATGATGGIGGREFILFIGPSDNISIEAWRVFSTWDVERRENDKVVAIHPFNQSSEMELPTLKQAITTAHQARVAANAGRIGPDENLPMLVTDANHLRQYFSDPEVGAYAPGVPAPAQPPPPCGLAIPYQANNPGLMRDCITLLTLKDTLQGTATLNWSVDTPIADWEGVWVQGSPRRVTGLILSSKDLTGTIPPDLARLGTLEHLRLDDNQLTGQLPAELGNLRRLRTLLLNKNLLAGEVPASWGNLDYLWQLQLANNQLTGCIPSVLRNIFTSDSRGLGLPACDPFNDRRNEAMRVDRYWGHDCLDSYDIKFRGGATWWMSPLPEIGSGALEQRVLENDLAVHAQVLSVNPQVVTIDSVKSRLLDPSNYDGFERTLLIEVRLRVQKYLKGDGPGEITVVVEGQSVFNTEEEGVCAKAAFAHVHGRLIESEAGIALLKQTNDPDFYHLGYADGIIAGTHADHSTWLASEEEMFYDGTLDQWIGIDEAMLRITSVVEEYDRRDDQRWQNCVRYKYWSKGRDRWRYRGIPWGHDWYRDHDIIFNGERVPVRAGETVWSYRDSNGYRSEFRFWLTGRDAHLFEVAYHSEFEWIANEWRAASTGFGHRQAVWYIHPKPFAEQWQTTIAGYTIKAVEHLPEGEYHFYLFDEDQSEDFVDCGQAHPEPNRFRIIVDADRSTVPPAASNVKVLDDPEGWTIVWDQSSGVEYYDVNVYRLDADGNEAWAYLGKDTEGPGYRIRFDELDGCDDLIYVRITPRGDGETYLRDFGVRTEPIELRTEPCEP